MTIAPTEPDEAASVRWEAASAVAAVVLALLGALALAVLLAGAGASASGGDPPGVTTSATGGHQALLRALPRFSGTATKPLPHGGTDVEDTPDHPAALWASPLLAALLGSSFSPRLDIGVACRVRPHGRAQSPRAPPPGLTA